MKRRDWGEERGFVIISTYKIIQIQSVFKGKEPHHCMETRIDLMNSARNANQIDMALSTDNFGF